MAGWYTVQQGDCLSSLAKQFGLANWHRIYDAPENSDFRQLRPDPNLILPGDDVYIPELTLAEKQAETDQRHKFKIKKDKTKLRIVIADEDGQPYKQCRYELAVGDDVLKGTTDATGMIEEEIDACAGSGELIVWWEEGARRHCRWKLNIGHLDPVATVSGIQARLNNLAFEPGPIDGISGPLTKGAVKRFQAKYKLQVDGIAGPITQGKLKEVHGC